MLTVDQIHARVSAWAERNRIKLETMPMSDDAEVAGFLLSCLLTQTNCEITIVRRIDGTAIVATSKPDKYDGDSLGEALLLSLENT